MYSFIMGRDYYKCITITCVGFTTTEEQYPTYMHLIGDQYSCFIYGDWDIYGKIIIPYLFIYDKSTLIYNSLEIPGPMCLYNKDLSTAISQQSQITGLFRSQIDSMKSMFTLPDGMCSCWSITSTIGIGEFQPYIQRLGRYESDTCICTSVLDYIQRHGYNSPED